MAVGDWDITKPEGTDYVNTVDNQIREDKETLLNALSKEHNFGASDTTCDHLEGSGKAWVDVLANRELRDSSRGRLFVETDTYKVYYGDSGDAWKWLTPKRNAFQQSFIPTGNETWGGDWDNIPEGAGDWQANLTTYGNQRQLLIIGSITVKSSVSGKNVYLCLAVDGIRVSNASKGQAQVKYADGERTVCINRLVTHGEQGINLSAGQHYVTMQWKVDDGGQAWLVAGVVGSLLVEEI